MGCLQQYQAEKIVEQATWTSSNNIKNWYLSKEGFVISLVGLQRNCLFWTLTTQPNDQFCCLHWTINEIKQCNWRKAARIDKSKKYCIQYDNARPHTSLVTRQKLLELGWDVLPYPPYSPDLAPSDYFLFRSLQNSLNGKNFNNDDDIKSYLIQLFANKNQRFYDVGLWCCLKDGKSLIKMGNTLQNKVI